MRIVMALGGNALLRRGEALTAENQRRNVEAAAEALAPIADAHELVVTHGNGPQVGLLALQGAAYKPDELYPMDVLDAETEGQIGYLIEQALGQRLPEDPGCATLLTQIEVDPDDPAFKQPSKPIGPVYSRDEGERLGRERGWTMAADGDGLRRVIASPEPRRILELKVIERLVAAGVTVVCGGGGGIPVVRRDDGSLVGVEAVIDKDRASALLARQLGADAFVMLTDVEAVWQDWGEPGARPIRRASPEALEGLAFAAGSMGPKVEAAAAFVRETGGLAGIGRLADAGRILSGQAGTLVTGDADGLTLGEPVG